MIDKDKQLELLTNRVARVAPRSANFADAHRDAGKQLLQPLWEKIGHTRWIKFGEWIQQATGNNTSEDMMNLMYDVFDLMLDEGLIEADVRRENQAITEIRKKPKSH